MTPESKKVLFFIKSPSHNLKSIELFLNKRNFTVFNESDIKEALTQIIEHQPDFIFLAWDHSSPVITSLPKLISQATAAIIVPYIMSNTKEAARKFNICPINPKLYPPISGPAIERLVLKFEKQSTEDAFKLNHIKTTMSTQEDLNTIKSNFMANLDNFINEAQEQAEESPESEQAEEQRHEQVEEKEKHQRKESIEKRGGLLRQSLKSNLTTQNIEQLKKSFEDKIKQPLENLINTLNETQNYGEVGVIDAPESSIGAVKITETSFKKADNGGIIIQEGASGNLGSIVQKGVGQGQELGTITHENTDSPQQHGSVILAERLKAYCMSVYSENWCGYLIITTAVQLDFSSVDMIFTDWIKQQFENMQEIDEYDFFEFRDVDPSILKNLTAKADYVETLEINGFALNVGFFPIEPDKMNIDLTDDKSLIKIMTEDIPTDAEIGFSLHLHLPENKKYLLYTQANKSLSYEQKKRLVTNKIFQLYTPLDFAKEYKKFMIEKNVRELYQTLSKKFSI
jgi:hypothetical protein